MSIVKQKTFLQVSFMHHRATEITDLLWKKKEKKITFFFPAGSFSSLFSHLRYNPPVKRIF